MTDKEEAELIASQMKTMIDAKRTITFLLIGRTGVGKSSTINSLLGADVAPTGKYQPTTLDISVYDHTHEGLAFNIVDTPGLCDDLPEAGKDADYLTKIAAVAKDADCVWFVSELDATRVTGDEKRGIKMITEALGEALWSRSIIVFTRSDKSTSFEDDLAERSKIVRAEIGKYFKGSSKIPSVAVSNITPLLPNGKPWLGELFTQVFLRFSDKGALPFLQSMSKDIGADETKIGSKARKEPIKKGTAKKTESATSPETEKLKEAPRIDLDEEQKEKIRESLWKRILSGISTGAGMGREIGMSFGKRGEAIGAAVGAVIGGVGAWLFGKSKSGRDDA